jgi:AraC family transcriptional regulator
VLLGNTTGHGSVGPQGRSVRHGPGTTSLRLPGPVPEMELCGEGLIFSLMLDPEWLGTRRHLGPKDPFLYQLAQEAAARLERDGTLAKDYAESLAVLVRGHLEEVACPPVRSPLPLELEVESQILEHIERGLEGPLPLSNLAALAGLSPSHFARAFREAMGETPHRYVMRQRVERARALLGQVTLAEAAARCGFSSQSHLSRCFVEHYGQPPGALRRFLQKTRKGRQD